jgi:hypothetical protein
MNFDANETIDDEHSQRVGRSLSIWLSQQSWEVQELVDWLQGYTLPPVGQDEEPFVWILRGVTLNDDRYKAESELAFRLARFIETEPGSIQLGKRPNQVLYNLFMLCAGLSYPKVLGESLYAIYEKRSLEGEWLGVDLRDALLMALVSNQIDNRLQSIWEYMLSGGTDDFLPGDEFDGFNGILLMPSAETGLGEPAMSEIGSALHSISKHLEPEQERRPIFSSHIKTAVEAYPGRPTWSADLIMQANEKQWPAWAVECIPNLYIPLEQVTGEKNRTLIWHYILACVPCSYKYEILDHLCKGHVLDTRLSDQTALFVEYIAPYFERVRIGNQFPSERSMIGIVAGAMSDLEMWARAQSDSDIADHLSEVRRQILEHSGVMPNVEAIGEALQKLASTLEPEQSRESDLRSIVQMTATLYPEIDLKKQAESQHMPSWALECLEKAA